jgi:RNA polymerase sigma factor (sigma-70 family)
VHPDEHETLEEREPRRTWSDDELRELCSEALAFALTRCRHPADAEDLAQEAVLRLIMSRRVENPRAWLAIVVKRLAWRRAQERHREEAALREVAAAAPKPSEPKTASRRHDASRLLAHASSHDQRLLYLDAIGLSDAEIAAAVGCRPGSIHTLLSRARRRLRAELQSHTTPRIGD